MQPKVAFVEVTEVQRAHQRGIDGHLTLSVRQVVWTSLSQDSARCTIATVRQGVSESVLAVESGAVRRHSASYCCQCFLLPPTGQSLLLLSLRPSLTHLLPLGFLPLVGGSLWCNATANLSAVTMPAARTAIRPPTLKTRTIRTDGSKTCMKQTLFPRYFRIRVQNFWIATNVPDSVAPKYYLRGKRSVLKFMRVELKYFPPLLRRGKFGVPRLYFRPAPSESSRYKLPHKFGGATRASFFQARINSTVAVPSSIRPWKESSKGWGFLDQHVEVCAASTSLHSPHGLFHPRVLCR